MQLPSPFSQVNPAVGPYRILNPEGRYGRFSSRHRRDFGCRDFEYIPLVIHQQNHVLAGFQTVELLKRRPKRDLPIFSLFSDLQRVLPARSFERSSDLLVSTFDLGFIVRSGFPRSFRTCELCVDQVAALISQEEGCLLYTSDAADERSSV